MKQRERGGGRQRERGGGENESLGGREREWGDAGKFADRQTEPETGRQRQAETDSSIGRLRD